jgi:hypothetical protein
MDAHLLKAILKQLRDSLLHHAPPAQAALLAAIFVSYSIQLGNPKTT